MRTSILIAQLLCMFADSYVDYLAFKANRIGPVGVSAITEAISQNGIFLGTQTAMRVVDLSGNPVGDDGAVAIAKALQYDRSGLTDLYLSGTADGDGAHTHHPIGDRGAMALAVALQSNTNLRTLNLMDQKISRQGAQALGDMLKKNSHLEILSLSDNPIGLDGVSVGGHPRNRLHASLPASSF